MGKLVPDTTFPGFASPRTLGYSRVMHPHGDISILRLALAGALALGLLLRPAR